MKHIFTVAALLAGTLAARGQSPMEDQAHCHIQAQRVYRTEIAEFVRNNPGADGSFTSHYNPTLEHCFVKIEETTDGFPGEVREIVKDAFEGTQVAWFVGRQDPKDMRLMIPEVCQVAGNDLRYESDLKSDYGDGHLAGSLKGRAEFKAAVLAAYGVQ
jgi:hypothetical protein